MLHQRVMVPSSLGHSVPMDIYVPQPEACAKSPRPAVVICPGGGYRFCSEREAEPVALRFLELGFNAFVVWYRVHLFEGVDPLPHTDDSWYKASSDHRFPMPQQDAAACIACVRAHAEEWNTHPDQIAIMGFSAGGHLAASVAGLWHHADLWAEMNLRPEDVRPNAAVLSYPVIVADRDAHRGSFEHLSGGDKNVENHQQYSILNWVTENYPPTFLWHTFTDGSVPVQNSIRMAHALADQGVLSELHIFPEGVHGLSLANELTMRPGAPELIVPECQCWPELAARFLKNAMK